MRSELDAVSDQGQQLIKRFGSLRNFLIQDESIVLVDDYICLQNDIETARSLALNNVIQNTSILTNGLASSTSMSSSSNVWNTTTPIASGPSQSSMEQFLQLPEVESSLFDMVIKPPATLITSTTSRSIPAVASVATKVTIPSSFPVPPPPLQSGTATPPPLLRPYSSMVASTGASSASSMPTISDIENMTKSMSLLNNTNADLMRQITAKEEIIKELKAMVDPDLLKQIISLEQELKEAKKEILILTAQNNNSEALVKLQKELEREKLNSRTLKNQVDADKDFIKRMDEKLQYLKRYCTIFGIDPTAVLAQQNQPSPRITPSTEELEASVGQIRGLWPGHQQQQPPRTQQQQQQQQAQPRFSSSAGSILFQNHFSNPPALQPPPISTFDLNLIPVSTQGSQAQALPPPRLPQQPTVDLSRFLYRYPGTNGSLNGPQTQPPPK